MTFFNISLPPIYKYSSYKVCVYRVSSDKEADSSSKTSCPCDSSKMSELLVRIKETDTVQILIVIVCSVCLIDEECFHDIV